MAKTEVESRLSKVEAKHKVLSISNFNTFQYQTREYLANQFEIFDNKKLIGYTDFKGKKFHSLIVKVRAFIQSLINKDKAYEKFKQEENKKLTEWFNKQQTNNQTSSLASFILSNYVINYDITLLNSKKIVDRPTENRELTIDNVKHPEHSKWLDSEIERLEKADKFRELPY